MMILHMPDAGHDTRNSKAVSVALIGKGMVVGIPFESCGIKSCNIHVIQVDYDYESYIVLHASLVCGSCWLTPDKPPKSDETQMQKGKAAETQRHGLQVWTQPSDHVETSS